MCTLSEDYLYVVAIDFGTTYSGYAFSSRSDFSSNPLMISSNQAWNAGTQRHISLKTPTCLLLDSNKDFVAFGYEAENSYAEIAIEEKQNEYFFFQRFKMQLYNNQQIKADMVIEDVMGKPVSAMKVFAESIKALTKHLSDSFKEKGLGLKKEDVRWVLTVPAIWTDAAKQFMRKCANKADIADDQLVIALEPEAASIFCQYLPTEKLQGAEQGFVMSKVGTKYMVVDNGGGTVDITIHEKMSNGALKEICRASGGDCGGTSVDMAFFQLYVNLVGESLMDLLRKEAPFAYLDIFREFEMVKRTVDQKQNDQVMVTFPSVALNEICKNHIGKDFTTIVDQSCYKDQITIRRTKMLIDSSLITALLQDASDKIVKQIKKAIESKYGSTVDLIILVGGFSQCKFIQSEIRSKFPSSKVISPEGAEIAVLKGAVLFGHRPDYIFSRIARYTYGVETHTIFDQEIHDPAKKDNINGKDYCSKLFSKYVQIGQAVNLGEELTHNFLTLYEFQSEVPIHIFGSTLENPLYTDGEDCILMGTFSIKIPTPSKEKREIDVHMIFGNTELMVKAEDIQSGETCETTVDLI